MSLMLALLLATAPPTVVESPSLATPITSTGAWTVVYTQLQGDTPVDVVCVETTIRWQHAGTGEVFERQLQDGCTRGGEGERWSRMFPKLAKVPDLRGTYEVQLEFTSGGHVVSRTAPSSVRVIGLLPFTGIVLLLFAALIWAGAAALRWRDRSAWVVAVATVATSPFWGPLLMGGHAFFLPVYAGLVALRLRFATDPDAFLRWAAVWQIALFEIYWGTLVNNSYATAAIVSLSLLYLVYRGLARLIRTPRRLSLLLLFLSSVLSLFYVAMNLYKLFFLDYPALAVAGDSGQVSDITDSIAHVFAVTHVLTLLAPFFVAGLYADARRRSRAAWSQKTP